MKVSPIKMLRVERGWRQADLEKFTGIPQPRISLFERRVQVPTPDERKRIAKAFGLAEARK